MEYINTTLWKASLADHKDGSDNLRKELRDVFETARKNVKEILDKIRVDFPALTVHDITHVDSLWQVGSLIVGDDYELNPMEGFVLGCAFLMHDAVLSYDAAGGRDTLRSTVEWQDFYADYKKNNSLSSDAQLYETDFRTIRFLHAKYVETIYNKLFYRIDGASFYIIENERLRKHLGALICKIAASHHWSIDDVERLGIQQAALAGYPREWRINPMKLACILRCADAGHIDEKRAPDFLLRLLTLNGVSRSHWEAQNRLSQIDIDMNDEEKVVINSNIDFREEDFAAWNVACDAVQVLDHEIKASNGILKKNNIQEFKVKGVSGAQSRECLSKYIKTDGWTPSDAYIHISNVEGLIKNLGGEKLYGNAYHLEIVLRELIQNARDAIVARRKREPNFIGKICVSIDKKDGETWVNVTDDGVGMSMQTIKDYLLNFGSSFWASDLAKSEYPGLSSSNFKSIGRFGIGFYAIFMVASEVIVETRKFDEGLDRNIRIKFPFGLCLRPIITKLRSTNMSVSTSIRFMIDKRKVEWVNTMEIKANIYGRNPFHIPYSNVISYLTAGLDVDVYYSELNDKQIKVHTNIYSEDFDKLQWIKDITHAEYREKPDYINYINSNYTRLRNIYHDGELYGIAAINTMYEDNFSCFGITTIGGLANWGMHSGDSDFLGCMFVEPQTAKRDTSIMGISLTDWALEQYHILCKNGLTKDDKLYLPYILGKYGVDMTDVMIVRVIFKSPKKICICLLSDLLQFLKNECFKLVLPLISFSDSYLEVDLDYERTLNKMENDELLFVVEKNSNFLTTTDPDSNSQFNIMHCINVIAKKLNLAVNTVIQDNKSVSRMHSNGKAIILTVL